MRASMGIVSLIDIIGSLATIGLSFYAVRFMLDFYRSKKEYALVTFLFAQTAALAIFAVSRSAGHILKHVLVALDLNYAWKIIAPVSGSINSFTFIVFGLSALMYANVRDVSERVRSLEEGKERLRESEEKYRSLIEMSPDMIHLLDDHGRFLSVNSVEANTLGYSQEDLLNMSIYDIVPAEFKEQCNDYRDKLYENGKVTFETFFVTKEGKSIPVEINSVTNRLSVGKGVTALFIARDITDRKMAENTIRKSLEEKEILLREIHHRVKNNMQVISSLLNLQSARISDTETVEVFRDSCDRIRAMALAHECLYMNEDLANVKAGEYLKMLTDNILRSFESKAVSVDISLDIDDLPLDIDTIIPTGLIVNELMSNAIKYAFDTEESPHRVHIALKGEGSNISLCVEDNGRGLPEGLDPTTSESLGMQLVSALVYQLDGSITLDREHDGTRFVILFPKEI